MAVPTCADSCAERHESVPMKKTPRIALLIDISRVVERDIIRGILRYSRLHGPWIFFRNKHIVSGSQKATLQDLKKWNVDGIICREDEESLIGAAPRIPLIIMPNTKPSDIFPNIVSNDIAIGSMAAQHLIDHGFRTFAFYGIANACWSAGRQHGFTATLAQHGFPVHVHIDPEKCPQTKTQILLKDWLSRLPQPLGLLTCNDECCIDCFEACKMAGLNIPEQVAAIGVDNDELACDFTHPPLSSIALNAEQAGYRAAELLAEKINDRHFKIPDIVIDPLRVVVRGSTDMLAVEDKAVAKAMTFIRNNANNNIKVKDVIKAVSVSRRVLYDRFKKTIGRSIHSEIRHVQMKSVAAMLAETDLTIAEIACKIGCRDAKNLSRVFKREEGMNPLAYRKKHRKGGTVFPN
jgi:LacI family transcriptional regulator